MYLTYQEWTRMVHCQWLSKDIFFFFHRKMYVLFFKNFIVFHYISLSMLLGRLMRLYAFKTEYHGIHNNFLYTLSQLYETKKLKGFFFLYFLICRGYLSSFLETIVVQVAGRPVVTPTYILGNQALRRVVTYAKKFYLASTNPAVLDHLWVTLLQEGNLHNNKSAAAIELAAENRMFQHYRWKNKKKKKRPVFYNDLTYRL